MTVGPADSWAFCLLRGFCPLCILWFPWEPLLLFPIEWRAMSSLTSSVRFDSLPFTMLEERRDLLTSMLQDKAGVRTFYCPNIPHSSINLMIILRISIFYLETSIVLHAYSFLIFFYFLGPLYTFSPLLRYHRIDAYPLFMHDRWD